VAETAARRAFQPADIVAPRMEHTPFGYWIQEAGLPEPAPALRATIDADVAIVGGGYLGMWTAWHVLQRAPQARVVLLEAGIAGTGPSGRNGGFVDGYWDKAPAALKRFGREAAIELLHAAQASADAVGAWCAEQDVDAWYCRAPRLEVSTSTLQDGAWEEMLAAVQELGETAELTALTAEQVAQVARSPIFRAGVQLTSAATVQPARLAFGLRDRLLARGVRLFEHTRVRRVEDGASPRVITDGGEVRAGAIVLAVNHATAGVRPLRNLLSVASSHIVLTEPVPDVLERVGWTGGQALSDCRTMLHYFRTTPDGRIAFGWGGGRMALGSRRRGVLEVDRDVAARAHRDLLRVFGELEGRRITHAWGGPIDVSPTRLAQYRTLDGGRVHAGFGFTGNGVGPTHLGGRILSALALDERDPVTRLCVVDPPAKAFPPEPLRLLGGSAIRAAMVRQDDLADEGRRPDPVTGFVASLPRRLGMSLPR
jgi:glycine/D-amino acid oxidase-like deaminating enzyme